MSETIDIYKEVSLPAIALRGIVAFPGVQTSIEIVRNISLKAFTAAATVHDAKIILVAQKDLAVEDPKEQDMYRVGTLAKIVHVVKNPQGNLSVVFEGIARVKIDSFDFEPGFMVVSGTAKKENSVVKNDNICDALIMEVKSRLSNLKNYHPTFTEEMRLAAESISAPGYLADFVASSAIIDYKNKQTVLESMRLHKSISISAKWRR